MLKMFKVNLLVILKNICFGVETNLYPMRKILSILFLAFIFYSCSKKETNPITQTPDSNTFKKPEAKQNPLSISHAREVIKKYKITKADFKGNNEITTYSSTTNYETEYYEIPDESQSVYITYSPTDIDPETLQILQHDNLAHVFNFPFANGEVYSEASSLNENTSGFYQNGNIYAYIPITDNYIDTYVNNIHPTIIDTLYQPVNDQDPVFLYSLVDAGYISLTEAQELMHENVINSNPVSQEQVSENTQTHFFGSVFKRPRGFVRYTDTELGQNQPVMGSRVYTLVFGVPIFTHTNNDGYFQIPWRFLVGTIVITQARNNNVTVKPLNLGFLVGSIHVHGWVGRGSLENININYTQHNQARYWAHILNGVRRYRNFCEQNGISAGPTHLTVWARWQNGLGSASAPLLNHVNLSHGVIETLANTLLNTDIDLAFELPNLPSLMGVRILPDMILSASKNQNDYLNSANKNVFSSALSQVIFHEMGHASHFIKAGHSFYVGLMTNTFFTSIFNGDSGYGTYGSWWSENVQIAESWAEFIGDRVSIQVYPNGWKRAEGNFRRTITFMETDKHFINDWIPYGILNDLQDGDLAVTPVVNSTATEPWDNVSGATTNELYNTLGSNVRGMADFKERFLQLYPRFNRNDVQQIYNFHQ